MKYKVRIEDRDFNVEVGDTNARPIQVNVDGEIFEIWPETLAPGQKPSLPVHPSADTTIGALTSTLKTLPETSIDPERNLASDQTKLLRAPIPGIIIKVAVQAGAEVVYGQELCVLEAMKMNNMIRAPRAGTIAAVHVNEGKLVKHGDVLMEFA